MQTDFLRKRSKALNADLEKSQTLTTVRKTIDIKAPVDTVFTYFARPEHVSDQMTEKGVAMTVIPMDIKDGMGVGTTFRIVGDFGGKRLEWDCETTEFVRERKIAAKMISGPFKKWDITTEFTPKSERLTSVTMTVNYEMPFGPLGGFLSKLKFAKTAEKGMESALYKVKGLLEGNGSIPVYITLEAYQKLLEEKKKMNNVPVSTVLTAILEKYNEIEAKTPN